MKHVKRSAGFTFVEIIISIVILGIMGLMTFSFIGNTTEIYGITTAQARLNDQLWVAMERISRETQQSQTQVIESATPTPPYELEFTIFDPSKAGCTSCVDQSTTIVYGYDQVDSLGGDVWKLYRNGFLLADMVSAFNVTKNTNIFTIDMTKIETVNNNDISITLSTTVYPNSDFEEVIQ